MKKTTLTLLKACSLSVALLGSAAVIAALAVPDAAYAKSGNDGGNGNGGGKGNGGGNGKSDHSGGAKGKADKSDAGKATGGTKTKAKSKVVKPKKKDLATELGVSPSELGALNAAHANPNALKNASPNSRVGRIAAYRDAVLAGEGLEAELAAKQAELDTLTPPARSSDEIDAELATATADVGIKAGLVTDLEADLAAAGGSDPAIEADLEAARQELADAQAEEADLAAELADAEAYETLSDEVADLTQQIEDQPELERSLLEAAANKPVTDEVEAAVKMLLGL